MSRPPLEVADLIRSAGAALYVSIEFRKVCSRRKASRRVGRRRATTRRNWTTLPVKESSGPICGVCIVSHAWFYQLNPASWSEIEKYASALCMDDSHFWAKKRSACFATLMRLENVIRLRDISVQKLDPRGWAVLKNVKTQRSLL
jgi:hypothetical protein